ncbi:uncharacterized protein A1O9_04064 [Exophiala aquamarina CBS 119918]|uniref:Transcription factor domain-containing protein n=1 Tax=Exophiala aquamarina CBS 119918 TaxID=1182545 RepID=A0A072PUL9_9EURO|nr:uncharacterized protein A1O9_04064 [Exophiala aquamarina CBS 119918]KEF59220.1 hypothetical protein A1O9_04064 [Exophiala aquamarina CBS 119918]
MPPRRGRTPNNNPDFLWVNRGPGSDRLSASRQGREELRTITSHARTWRAALRRQQRLVNAQTYASRAQRVVGWSRSESRVAQSDPSSSETSAAPSPAPHVPFASDDVAPFAYLEQPGDARWSQNAFQYATQSWLPAIFQNLSAFDKDDLLTQSSVKDTIDSIIQGCLHNRMHMLSLLSASSGHLKFVLRAQLDKVDTAEYCNGKALQYIRHHLTSDSVARIDEFVIFDLMALSAFERYVGNPEGARTHFGMVRHLIESHGGLDSIDLPLHLLCLKLDMLVAAGTGERPLMFMTWDPGALPAPQSQEVQRSLLQVGAKPGGAFVDEHETLKSSAISEILIGVVQWFQVQQLVHLLPSDQVIQQRSWAARRSYALAHQLLCITIPTAAATFPSSASGVVAEQGNDKLLECIRQGCLITVSAIEESRSVRIDHQLPPTQAGESFAFYNIALLRQALTDFVQDQNRLGTNIEHQELILWVTCMAAQKSTQHGDGPQLLLLHQFSEQGEDRDWFVDLAGQMARHLHVTTALGLADVLARYTFNLNVDASPNTAGLESVLLRR